MADSQQTGSNGPLGFFSDFTPQGARLPSPYDSPHDDHDLFGPDSPWSPSSLTLPPLNTSQNFEENESLPHFHDQLFNPGLSWSQNPNPFAQLSTQSSDNEQHQSQEPPPSNQQARHPQLQSQFRIDESDSPDPFDTFFDLQDTPPRDIMPPRRTTNSSNNRSTRSSVVDLTASSSPRAAPAPRKRKAESPDVGRASKIPRPKSSGSHDLSKVAVVDLADVENEAQYEAMKAKEQEESIRAQNQAAATKPVKLAEFQCIICMDNPTDLTVTHCGHLFCSECLHQALHAGDKKCCPVCRTAISFPRNAGSKQPKNGVFVLEMKLMTANRKGKQPVRAR